MSDQRDETEPNDDTDRRSGFSRRGFLAGAAGLTGVALSGVWRGTPAAAATPAAPSAATPPGFAFLAIDGTIVGSVKSVEGGNAVGEVVTEVPGPGPITRKHLGGVKYEDITMNVGLGLGNSLWDWIKLTFDQPGTTKDGAVILTDAELVAWRRMDFTNAIISEFGMPALDGSSKEPAYFTVKISPGATSTEPASGRLRARPSNQQLWLSSNFRLSIGDLPTSRVGLVESLNVKYTLFLPGAAALEPTSVEYPNLTITMPPSPAWFAFFEDFVIKGNNAEDKELPGRLEILSTDLQTVLAALNFSRLGMVSFDLDRPQPSAVRRLRAEMYCEQMSFEYRPPT